ncbi:glucosaminidase domain-containing protein [Motiliproteus sp. MSK22-1]|uniref:glucosaminidase domain-containing protein n=1 Tax=Motiliproteus sp. MSK22-1 TaxID=1897630 RepID=UPI0009782705|nr:glucosaminidase domain-containing protein [Motiliproteus sp. MSK22-1]OMH30092.1 hypothetical protein BGP75_18945 [Motiliproteus sp. MSK22-1]
MVDKDLSFRSYTDFQGLNSLKLDAKRNDKDPETLEAVAKQFESLFLNMLMKNMRKANETFAKDSYFNSNQTKFYQDMLDQQLSLTLSEGKGFGLSEVMIRQLSPKSSLDSVATTDALSKKEGSSNSAELQRRQFDQILEQSARAAIQAIAKQENTDSTAESETKDGVAAPALPELKPGDFVDVVKSVEARLAQRVGAVKGTVGVGNEPVVAGNQDIAGDAQLFNQNLDLPERFDSPEQFVQSLFPLAQSVAGEMGIDPSVLIAQAALETGWGKHMPTNADGSSSFNLFGIKADSRWDGESSVVNTLEFKNGVAAREKAAFRAYGSYQESLQDYVSFVSGNPRYQPALEKVSDGPAYLEQLQLAGYATDPQYAQKIAGILTGDVLKTALVGIKEI